MQTSAALRMCLILVIEKLDFSVTKKYENVTSMSSNYSRIPPIEWKNKIQMGKLSGTCLSLSFNLNHGEISITL
jgi:hypothetical protein